MDGKQRPGCSAVLTFRAGLVNRIWMDVMVVVLGILLVGRGSDWLPPEEEQDAPRHGRAEGA